MNSAGDNGSSSSKKQGDTEPFQDSLDMLRVSQQSYESLPLHARPSPHPNTQVLEIAGVKEYDPLVADMLFQLSLQYSVDVMREAYSYSKHAGRGQINLADLQLAEMCRADKSFTRPLPRETYVDLARARNTTVLPPIPQFVESIVPGHTAIEADDTWVPIDPTYTTHLLDKGAGSTVIFQDSSSSKGPLGVDAAVTQVRNDERRRHELRVAREQAHAKEQAEQQASQIQPLAQPQQLHPQGQLPLQTAPVQTQAQEDSKTGGLGALPTKTGGLGALPTKTGGLGALPF